MTTTAAREWRDAFGQFATGVTIVTTCGLDKRPVGVTANSFSSVSLEPPMILWSLAKDSLSREAFDVRDLFCAHILTAEQREMSVKFAQRGENKFDGVRWSADANSIPLFDEYLARFYCRVTDRAPVGDHIVIFGEVLSYDLTEARPLLFHGGQYAHADRRIQEDSADKTTDRRRASESRPRSR